MAVSAVLQKLLWFLMELDVMKDYPSTFHGNALCLHGAFQASPEEEAYLKLDMK
jgi:hypothetical protein